MCKVLLPANLEILKPTILSNQKYIYFFLHLHVFVSSVSKCKWRWEDYTMEDW